ncbi:mannose/fructose/sorbose PTS transporter subunit IIB [Liquorilactobacillus satsumensis]|uniref:PTS system sorbose-specific transporter subunit IIB n=1 Tax=Liquorilactobacillus satsumensis DSM 16230 = JCM 12392 TaxID=1423801 RepID=A0A0R1V356_9LACO|nr:mannose/fructose/sorbose PTS transporter subunit IIB [Liquorilactobacillus satsumensis]KRL97672.1 PTS system sorbose-specific transporter subunit IIB [Liquorilactobacillus satsumensis DSM 16230 = JCM 12392]MCP9312046.1 PTS sugar transporter subunit IIB [Liquorilactobacillus satsumensis]MCP9329619.1 PTS sugar transporter subunit IIB [Liquorilactobacillus satsumensis]MCP9359180.1 PTS sugar transporter subunit IIB [Liquorilactobacillus satsumensis]
MIITLARIDDRLIHGQVTTVWSKKAAADRIIVVDEDVYKDNIRKTLLKQACPPGMKVNVVNVTKAAAVYKNPKYQDDKVFYLFTKPIEVLRLVEAGVPLERLNIGGMQYSEGKTQITKSVSLDQQDVDAFTKLDQAGVTLDLQVVESDPHINIMDKISEKFKG